MIFLLSSLFTAQAAEFRSADEVLATFADEPKVREVQRMTEEYAKTDARYVDAWLNASKNAAWLPRLSAQYEFKDKYRTDYEYIVLDGENAESQLDEANVEDYHKATVKAQWDLNELVMSSERIRMISESQDIVKLRDKVLEDVTHLYFERRKLQCDMIMNPGDLKAQLKNQLRLEELTAQLDAYTGGRFSAAILKK